MSATASSLCGRRIVVTRATEQADPLAEALRHAGATPVVVPAIRVTPRPDLTALDDALRHREQYTWMIVTSGNAATIVCNRLEAIGTTWSGGSTTAPRVAAVGPATADVLASRGIPVEVTPGTHRAAEIPSAIGDVAGARILWPRGQAAADTLACELRVSGAQVDDLIIYDTTPAVDHVALSAVLDDRVDAITFASASAADAVLDALGERVALLLGPLAVACIGPRTADAVQRHGLTADVVADDHTIAGLVRALAVYFAPDATEAAVTSGDSLPSHD